MFRRFFGLILQLKTTPFICTILLFHTLQLIALKSENVRHFDLTNIADIFTILLSYMSVFCILQLINLIFCRRHKMLVLINLLYLFLYGIISWYVFETKKSLDILDIIYNFGSYFTLEHLIKIWVDTSLTSILFVLIIGSVFLVLEKKRQIFYCYTWTTDCWKRIFILICIYSLFVLCPSFSLDEPTNFLISVKDFIAKDILERPYSQKAEANKGDALLAIAHGGGGYQGIQVTNSMEALNFNLRKGFVFFELDFHLTSDDGVVCIHDWKKTFKRLFKFELKKKPDLDTFKIYINQYSDYEICTLETLLVWLKNHPEVKIITDIKIKNIQVLRRIATEYPTYMSQFIPQVYDPNEYYRVKEMGYKQIIWTLYGYRGSNNKVINMIQNMDLFAVTIARNRAEQGLGNRIRDMGVPVYVHTLNFELIVKKYLFKYGATNIYTDFLSPLQIQKIDN